MSFIAQTPEEMLEDYRAAEKYLTQDDETFSVTKIHPYDLHAMVNEAERTGFVPHMTFFPGCESLFLIDGKAYFLTTFVSPKTTVIR